MPRLSDAEDHRSHLQGGDFSGDIKKFIDFAFMEAAHDAVRKTAGNPSGTSFLSDLLDHLFGDRLEGLARVGLDPLVLVW